MRFNRTHFFLALLGCQLILLAHPKPSLGREVLQEILIRKGDTLWSIANKYLKDPRRWPEILKQNKLLTSDPTIALPGTKIKIPILLIKEEFRHAKLVKLIPQVRFRRKGGGGWKTAKNYMTLQYEDAIRTMKGGLAHVEFPSKEIVKINENSYVVLKPDKFLQEVQLLQGGVRASRAKVIMPRGTVVKPKGRADFQARIREDDTEVVFVYKGKVDVTAQGKTVTVPQGYGTEVPKESPPLNPLPLPQFKDFNPIDLTAASSLRPKISQKKGIVRVKPPTKKKSVSAKKPKPRAKKKSKALIAVNLYSGYLLQIAKNDKFETILYETKKTMGDPIDIQTIPLKDDTYFMRVAFIDALGVQGTYSYPSAVTKDTEPPVFKNLVPEEGKKYSGEDHYCEIVGYVSGAAVLTINGEIAFVSPSGRFGKFITLKDGENLIEVMARDVNGNETLVQRKIHFTK